MATDIHLPDTGSTNPVDIIELHVKVGDEVSEGQTLMTLESDKATIDVPSPAAGKIEKLLVKVGQKVKTGDAILSLAGGEQKAAQPAAKPVEAAQTAAAKPTETPVEKAPAPQISEAKPITPSPEGVTTSSADILAGPAVRRLARLLGVDLSKVNATGERNRISKDDVKAYVKNILTSGATTASGGFSLPSMPVIDFAQFGAIESSPLSRIKKLTSQNLSRNWLLAPHVTQFDEADITDLEAFRKRESARFEKQGVKLTPLVFIMKAVVSALKEFPQFNASIDHTGDNLILKKHYHIGIAVDTPDGLVVPVIRNVDQKSLTELAKELAEVSVKAREKKLSAQDMQGSSFTISSLGGIGGKFFTPIINLPNVAILGVSKSSIKPIYDGSQFQPRLILPLSLSYDHRVIDGAEGARFCVKLAQLLGDIRNLLL
ncbi:MAG: Dihydrolipoyllysine-residue acetyltransferase component of pyruvate dehydrogenase complex [Gammaproteobacteria bacterium]|jgi:pyruvate dehydrogenase E2 component (dihydrolipoamide acetyltransferase)|nr:Dihydrolipoyllysine-residue acetyltransferase component of pyruvate dehydrogenase complex [Gammaproteobacteria bacterium]